MKLLKTLICSALTTAVIATAQPTDQDPRAWTKEGIVAASNMEALSFVRRRGGQTQDFAQKWQQAMSEEEVVRLKQAGVNTVMVTLMKGAGFAAEAEDIAATRKFVQAAHRHGVKVGGYVGASLFIDTLFAEEPDAKNWAQRDEAGRPVTYGGDQTFRWMACRNNPGYIAFLKRAFRVGVEDLKLDFIHFDQLRWWRPPEICHCQHCQASFRDFVQKKYSPAEAKERFGYESMGAMTIPLFPPGKVVSMPAITNPIMHEWAIWRSENLAERYAEFADYIRSMNPAVAVMGNPKIFSGSAVGFEWGVDSSKLLRSSDIVWSEEGSHPRWTSDNRLVTLVRTYKQARGMNNALWVWHVPPRRYGIYPELEGSVALGLAEAMAYNRNDLGVVAGFDTGDEALPEDAQRYVRFFHERQAELRHAQPSAEVAVLRTFESNEFSPSKGIYSTVLYEQSLLQSQVPFDMLFGNQMDRLSRYKVVVLANQDALSDETVSKLKEFVAKGGGLVITEATGSLDNWRRPRPAPAFSEFYRSAQAAAASGLTAVEHQKGRIVYLAAIEPDGKTPPKGMIYAASNAYWKLPLNHRQLVEAVKWASKESLNLSVVAPEWVAAEVTRKADRQVVHLINYKKAANPVQQVRVGLSSPVGRKVSRAVWYSPDDGQSSQLKVSESGGRIEMVVPELLMYGMLVIEFTDANTRS
jgi:Beta-galactosidase trimerisation domain